MYLAMAIKIFSRVSISFRKGFFFNNNQRTIGAVLVDSPFRQKWLIFIFDGKIK